MMRPESLSLEEALADAVSGDASFAWISTAPIPWPPVKADLPKDEL